MYLRLAFMVLITFLVPIVMLSDGNPRSKYFTGKLKYNDLVYYYFMTRLVSDEEQVADMTIQMKFKGS